MPTYRYKTINDEEDDEFFEIDQHIKDSPLTKHPISGEPVKRVLNAPSLSLSHASSHEKNTLSNDHLNKHGFTKYEKDHESGDYYQTVGKNGPSIISADQIKNYK